MRKKVEARFGAWKAEGSPAPAAAGPWKGEGSPAPAVVGPWKGTPGGRVLLVAKDDALQTYFQFGNLGFDRRDKDYAARTVANSILGERFTGWLNKVLR